MCFQNVTGSGKELSFSRVSLSDSVGLGEGPLVFISDKLPGVADAAGSLLFSSKKRMDWILSVRKFPETVVSRMHLEMVLTLRGCIWDLEDERKAVLMFKILSYFKILKKKAFQNTKKESELH